MKDKIIKAINKGINNALILFDREEPSIFKKSSDDGELGRQCLWVENNTVDLGLPSGTRWAACNIGAERPTEYGMYFLWGDPTGYTNDAMDITSGKWFGEYDYKWYNPDKESYTKYNNEDKQTELDLDDDPAYIHSDGKLISPTVELCVELYDYCDWSWTTIDGVKGYKVLSKVNENYIFLPANGYCSGRSIYYRGSYGNYWSRSLHSNIIYAYYIYFYSSGIYPAINYDRYSGFSVRAVLL